ncbi:MAG: dipeptide epimerase [Elusimicrobia bacterium]|nr:dipeptide epimerase [Elusimicrobiota bacterium]
MRELEIEKVKVGALRSPLIMPFTISSGSHKILENVYLEITLKNGIKGFGEAPIASHITGESFSKTAENLKKFAVKTKGYSLSNYLRVIIKAEEELENNRAALFALQTAVCDAFCKSLKIPMWKFYGNKPKKVQTDITVVIGDEKTAFDFTQKMRKKGFKVFKIKVGSDFDSDIKRVLAVSKASQRSEIYLDANCAYSAKEALSFLSELGKKGVCPTVVEQPVKKEDLDGLKEVSRKSKSVVLADESAYSLNDAVRIIDKKAASGINIKLTKLGLLRAAEIRRLALSRGLKLMIGQMMESQLATFAALHFSLGSGGFDFLDLDTPYFLAGGIMSYPKNIMSSDGFYDMSSVKEGVGAQPKKR